GCSKNGWNFPFSKSYNSIAEDQTNQNFTGIRGEIETGKDWLKPVNNFFNPKENKKTTIWYNITQPGKVTIKIYTIDGTLVKTLLDEEKQADTDCIDWSGENIDNEVVASGIYYVHIQAPGFKDTKKICVVK
ncbi:MAG: T9SS type A sorting domain-containing protein, partial [Elusimicrobiota bacterium]